MTTPFQVLSSPIYRVSGVSAIHCTLTKHCISLVKLDYSTEAYFPFIHPGHCLVYLVEGGFFSHALDTMHLRVREEVSFFVQNGKSGVAVDNFGCQRALKSEDPANLFEFLRNVAFGSRSGSAEDSRPTSVNCCFHQLHKHRSQMTHF